MIEFTIHTIESAPPEARETLEAARKQFGFLPNLLGELAAAPSALKGYVTLSGLLSESSLRPIEQQLVLIAASLENGCGYCMAAHSAGLKMAGFADDQIDAVRSGRRLDDPKLEALRAFTTAVVARRGLVTQVELEQFLGRRIRERTGSRCSAGRRDEDAQQLHEPHGQYASGPAAEGVRVAAGTRVANEASSRL